MKSRLFAGRGWIFCTDWIGKTETWMNPDCDNRIRD